MEAHERLQVRVDREQDDILCTIQLVSGESELVDRLFDRLVDLLVESLFLDLRAEFLDGRVTRDEYVDQLAVLAEGCRGVGLLPLPAES